ncbi:hypothetical protein B2J88_45325 [Rhodococcus sp. SRB_17]|nr:hypothetical protein [Rhodococcus sp. SRB_17]
MTVQKETSVDSAQRDRISIPACLVIATATLFLILDLTAINVAAKELEIDLNASFEGIQWVLDGYATAMAATLLLCGIYADRFGPKVVLGAGAFVFGGASAFGALAHTTEILIVARSIQGVGAAALLAAIPVLIVQNFPTSRRMVGFGIFGAISGLALAGGPLIGGVLMTYGWQWIFWVNLPAMLVVVLILQRCTGYRGLNVAVARRSLSAAILGVCMFALVFALTHAYSMGFSDPRIILATVSVVGFGIAFALLQRNLEFRILDIDLFGNRTFAGISVVTFLVNAAVFPLLLISVLYFEVICAVGPILTGLRLMALTGAILVGSVVAVPVQSLIGRARSIGISLFVLATGLAALSFLSADSSWTALLPGYVITGLGLGIFSTLRAEGTAALVPEEKTGMASGSGNTLQELGVACGIAFSGSIFFSTMNSRILTAGGADDMVGRGAGSAIESGVPGVVDAFIAGWDRVVLLGSFLVLVALVVWIVSGRDSMFKYEP